MGVFFMTIIRRWIRGNFHHEMNISTFCCDMLAWACCCPCAAIQEALEVEHRAFPEDKKPIYQGLTSKTYKATSNTLPSHKEQDHDGFLPVRELSIGHKTPDHTWLPTMDPNVGRPANWCPTLSPPLMSLQGSPQPPFSHDLFELGR